MALSTRPSTRPVQPPISPPAAPVRPPKASGEDHLDEPALVLTWRDVGELSGYVGRNLQTVDDLKHRVKLLTTYSVEGADVTLEPNLLYRLKQKALRADFPQWLKDHTIRALRDLGGM